MEYNLYLQNCGNDDVISFGSELYKFGKFKSALESVKGKVADVIIESVESQGIKGINIYELPNRGSAYKVNLKWFDKGKDCEVLKISSKGWQKGKLRIKLALEFCPDEPEVEEKSVSNEPETSQPESPLDDIRQMINQNS